MSELPRTMVRHLNSVTPRRVPAMVVETDHLKPRECHQCRVPFLPLQTISGVTTESHCSARCALICLKRRASRSEHTPS